MPRPRVGPCHALASPSPGSAAAPGAAGGTVGDGEVSCPRPRLLPGQHWPRGTGLDGQQRRHVHQPRGQPTLGAGARPPREGVESWNQLLAPQLRAVCTAIAPAQAASTCHRRGCISHRRRHVLQQLWIRVPSGGRTHMRRHFPLPLISCFLLSGCWK